MILEIHSSGEMQSVYWRARRQTTFSLFPHAMPQEGHELYSAG
ncbi:hypothetical protein RMSM_02043 [Rhodopirellula maiorica SM1]|uniref:Uncharacterized protein n=1 Tax=Rhodopirellula maiorica SM1 TaxID=1265738 RepID=M5RP89_9BACT|nr:hypothetical protein RMSM_02043 [Rhodopirellula maiorica SM1]